MKKLFSLLIVALFASSAVLADDVSHEQALEIARQFAVSPSAQKLSRRHAPAKPVTQEVVFKMKSAVSDKPNVYVINLGNDQGFVIVSGEDGVEDVLLGYCDHGSFSYEDCPIQLKDLLTNYCSAIDSLRQNPKLAVPKKVAEYDRYLGSVIVEPLITSTWNQHSPYNLQCPEVTPEGTDLGYGYGGHYATGCVPTAIAQVLRYWRWPEATSGTVNGKDFSGHTYDWDNMLDNYRYGYTAAQANAVAQLMADVGYAMRTAYGQPNGSPTSFSSVALIENFGFTADCEELSASTAFQLQSAIKEELDENRPVPYCGHPSAGDGHALVCDGYSSNNYFHFNYGWGGVTDGWYKLTTIPMYRYNAVIWKNFRPYDAIKKVVDGVEYGLLRNGTAEIISYAAGGVGKANGVLIIPATIEDKGVSYKITRIRQRAFMRKGNFQKIVMGDNIKTIDAYSFFNNQIDTLVLSDMMEVVPDEAFQINTILHLVIGKNVKRIGKRAFYLNKLGRGIVSRSPAFEVDDEAFMHAMPALGDWTKCITSLGRKAFYGVYMDFWKRPQFDNLEEIGDSAFVLSGWGGGSPTIRLGAKVRKISPSAFDGMHYASLLLIDEDNPYFSRTGSPSSNIIYNKNQTSIILATGYVEEKDYAPTAVKMEPNSIRPDFRSDFIPNTIVEMNGAFKDFLTLGNSKNFYCHGVTPPVMTDNSFSKELLEEVRKDGTLHVPAGSEEAYRSAPGWRLFKNIVGDQEINPLPAQGRQYYMVVDAIGESQRLSIPINEVSSMEVSEDGQSVIIKRNGKEDITTSIAAINDIKWTPGFVYENAEIFELNDSTLTAEAQKCTVKFDATVIDDDVQLCVRNIVRVPNAPEDMVDGFAIDLSLSNGQHELYGTVEITVPFPANSDETVCAAYYNETSGEWEPVCFEYDRITKKVTITTDHLSIYSIYKVYRRYSSLAYLDPICQAERIVGTVDAFYTLKEILVKLIKIVESEYPEIEAVNQFREEMGLWQTLGLDGLWNIVSGTANAAIGFDPERLNELINGFGTLGTFISIYDVARAEAHGDDIAVASGALKTILNHTLARASYHLGTPIMSVSLGMVAFIGVALEKLGTTVAERKHDLFNEIYRYFYSKRGRDDEDVRSCYRSAQDWFKLLYPVILEGDMTESEWNEYIKKEVEDYCNQLWSGEYNDAYLACYNICKTRFPFTTFAWPEASMKSQLAKEHFAELMHGEMESVVRAIKNHLKVNAYNRFMKEYKSVADMINTRVGLRVVDSGWKEGETSQYEGWKIAFSDIPANLEDPENLQKKLNAKGRAGVGFVTEYALVSNGIPTQLTLYDPEDRPQKTYDFQIPDGKGKVFVDIDLATGGMKADKMPLEGLELTYEPNVVKYPYVCVDYDGEDYSFGLLYLDNTLNKRARFQTAIEQFFNRHDFVSVDKYGNYTIGDDIIGRFEGNGLESSGKFVIDVSHKYIEKNLDQFIREVAVPSLGPNDWAYGLLNGFIQHRIECNYKITRKSTNSNEFTVSFTGSGDYALLANVTAKVEGVDPIALVESARLGLEGPEIHPQQITTEEVSFDGKVTLKYSTTLKRLGEQQ